MNSKQRELLQHVLTMLEQHPEEWRRDEYSVTHPSHIEIWIANGHYGLSIRYHDAVVLGSVTPLSSFFGPLIPWRAKLRKAAMRIDVGDYSPALLAALKAVAA